MNAQILPKVVIFLLMSICYKGVSAQGIEKKKIKWVVDYDLKPACKDEISVQSYCNEWKDCGLCEDEYDSIVMRRYCPLTCGFCLPPKPPECLKSEYGCCWDFKTKALSLSGDGCPRCRDQFHTLCKRFISQCEKKGRNGEYVRKKCSKTCGFCRNDAMVIDEQTFNRHRTKLQ
uniref:Toxin candidate TRINITY_DN29413_c0_g1_i1 n=1 Tax=Pachycerianthus maua TaxID=2736681 RepID=A0A7G7WZ41_9CNID|nr:toxin candidate TRINITY_DN29413_c0_g1_i1 [Pachycerianthus maua]